MARSILLVDDDPEVARFLGALLSEYGYELHATTKLEDAYAVLRQNRVDVALVAGGTFVDGTGLALVRSLRKRGNRLPVIYLSDQWLDDARYDELVKGLDVRRIVRKPISPNELLVQLQMVLGSLPDEGLLEVIPEPLVTEEIDAQKAAHRIQAERARVETSLDRPKTIDPHARARVLLLNEDTESAQQFTRVAHQLQVVVEVAADLDGAAGLLHTAILDAAVVHLGLASVDPFHAARVLRTLVASLPIIFLGPDSDVDVRISAVHAGGSFLLVDPVSASDLEAALLRIEAERATLQPQVLLVDAHGTFAVELSAALRAFSEMAVLAEPKRIFEVLSALRPDAVLVAADLGPWSGFDVCRLIRSTPGWQHLPILLLLGDAPPEARIAAFEAGADDWLARPFLTEELLARIRVRAERIRTLSDRSAVDALTGLRNRSGFLQAARERLSEAQRASRPLSLGILEVDGLAAIQHDRGHLAGERLLSSVGRTLGQRFRLGDVRGRWSSGEFVLCLLGVDRRTATAVIDRVADELEAGSFVADDGTSFLAAFSGAVASYPEDGDTLDALFAAARTRLQ